MKMMCLQATEGHGLPATTRSWERQEVPSPGAFGGSWPCQRLDFGLPASRRERIDFCYFKPPSLWSFVTVAPGKGMQATFHQVAESKPQSMPGNSINSLFLGPRLGSRTVMWCSKWGQLGGIPPLSISQPGQQLQKVLVLLLFAIHSSARHQGMPCTYRLSAAPP